MKNSEINEEELIEECFFWAQYTGKFKKPAKNFLFEMYYVFWMFIRAFLIVIYYSLKYSKNTLLKKDTQINKNQIIAFSFTHNQKKALDFTSSRKDVFMLSQNSHGSLCVSWVKLGILTLKKGWKIFFILRKRHDSELLIPWIEEFVRYEAGYEISREIFSRLHPKIIIISNDHNGLIKAFIKEAKRANIFIIYTQHASIGNNFPKLNFGLALLDGIGSYEQYQKSGDSEGTIVLTGRNKGKIEKQHIKKRVIGLGTNHGDDILPWIRLIKKLKLKQEELILRCHPAERRKILWKIVCRYYGVTYNKTNLNDFLDGCHTLIASVSGILIDGCLKNIKCFIYSYEKVKTLIDEDYYGYFKNEICDILTLDTINNLYKVDDKIKISQRSLRVGIYEVGLVCDPNELKLKALNLAIQSIEEKVNIETLLEKELVLSKIHKNLFFDQKYEQFLSPLEKNI